MSILEEGRELRQSSECCLQVWFYIRLQEQIRIKDPAENRKTKNFSRPKITLGNHFNLL